MRTALIAATTRTDSGMLRAELRLAERSILAWQVELMRALGAERILCLCDRAQGEVLRLQHEVEAAGAAFHALRGFAAIPALVRADDELIILRDGLVPDPAVVRDLLDSGPQPHFFVACLPGDHPLAITHPEDFERIDATRHWAGLLVMRGAPVQQLADFPADADAVSVLLRLALQSGTSCREMGVQTLTSGTWLLADSAAALAAHEQALIARAGAGADWRAPMTTLAAMLVRRLAPRGLAKGAQVGAGVALVILATAGVTAALGAAAGGLALAAIGTFAAGISVAYARLAQQLLRRSGAGVSTAMLSRAVDGLTATILLFALAPLPQWTPLAVCGPIAIGLARLAARRSGSAAPIWSDRASQLAVLALTAIFDVLPEAVALMAAISLGALLLRKPSD